MSNVAQRALFSAIILADLFVVAAEIKMIYNNGEE